MSLYERLLSGEAALSLTGLGYVGMPIAVAFSKKVRVIGFDTNQKKIDAYKNGIDPVTELELISEKTKSKKKNEKRKSGDDLYN